MAIHNHFLVFHLNPLINESAKSEPVTLKASLPKLELYLIDVSIKKVAFSKTSLGTRPRSLLQTCLRAHDFFHLIVFY